MIVQAMRNGLPVQVWVSVIRSGTGYTLYEGRPVFGNVYTRAEWDEKGEVTESMIFEAYPTQEGERT